MARGIKKEAEEKNTGDTHREFNPAHSLKEREDQLVLLATDLAEKQLRDGTAAPSVINHYLKLRTSEEQLRLKMLEEKTTLLHAQTEAVKSQQRVEELYSQALAAMKEYSGSYEKDK